MTILSDADIKREMARGELGITPYDPENLGPGSYDVTLDTEFVHYPPSNEVIDPQIGIDPETAIRETGPCYDLAPNEFVLGTTVESVTLSDYIAADVKGRSSIGRLGVIPHTAGFVDNGYEGQITLEFVNHNNRPVKLVAGMAICQLVFSYTETPADVGYGDRKESKYQGQSGVTESRIHGDFERDT